MDGQSNNLTPAAPAMPLEEFERLAKTRRTVRKFRPDPLPAGVLDRLLSCAQWAPSGYNLQPTHFFICEDPSLKPVLAEACMKQKQVIDAPATVVFAGDRQVYRSNFADILAAERSIGNDNEKYIASLEKFVPLAFSTGPLGFGWLWKSILPILRPVMALPELPATNRRLWLSRQVMLTAMNFMLAAHAAGLATVPMEGFDESRVRRVMKIPKHFAIFLVIPVGYAVAGDVKKSRLPLERFVHRVTA